MQHAVKSLVGLVVLLVLVSILTGVVYVISALPEQTQKPAILIVAMAPCTYVIGEIVMGRKGLNRNERR